MSVCPECQRELPAAPADDPAWAPVARLTNLAEVGFFADIVEGGGIGTNVLQHNEFSALDGRWETVFVLRVPRDEARHAAQLLRDEASDRRESAANRNAFDTLGADTGRPASGGPFWTRAMLMVFVLIVGGIAYFAVRGTTFIRSGTGSAEALMRALSDSDQPLTLETPPDGAGAARRLRYLPESRTILLEYARDGDGRWDRQQPFRVPETR